MVDPTLDAILFKGERPLSVNEIQEAADGDLAPFIRFGPGNAFQMRNPLISNWIPTNFAKGICFRHRSVWPRADFLEHPELAPPGHGETAYVETNLVWEQKDLSKGFGMFPHFGERSYFGRELPTNFRDGIQSKMIEPQPVGRFALINGRVVLPGAVAVGKAVIVEGARIVAVVDADALGAGVHAVDVGGRYIVPGLIDIHTHGAVGRSFNEPSAEAWATIAQRNAACGVTSLLATLATASIDDLVACLRLAREWSRRAARQARRSSECIWKGRTFRTSSAARRTRGTCASPTTARRPLCWSTPTSCA